MLMEIRQRSPKTGTANSSPSGRITQHIRYGLSPFPFGTLLPSVATLHMLVALYAMPMNNIDICKGHLIEYGRSKV
ncbi:hypothetical protein C5S39_10685 [Candidatus Methanophagaceae archaeon]|nr:hypothetical protein C5S39_10685 [Methanophagales archaeon]